MGRGGRVQKSEKAKKRKKMTSSPSVFGREFVGMGGNNYLWDCFDVAELYGFCA